jgi:hypothetical protein
MLRKPQLPQLARGALKAEASLKDQDDRTAVDVDASLGDTYTSVQGLLANLGLTGSDLHVDVVVGNASMPR